MAYFGIHSVNDHVFHLFEPLGVGVTLVVGGRLALLFDTGYGVGDLAGEVAAITDLPLVVMNSHGHFDHACGNYQFPEILIDPADFSVAEKYTSAAFCDRGLDQAREQRLVPADHRNYGRRREGFGKLVPFGERSIDLGGIVAELVSMPGHTPGSTGVFLREDRLVLAGDTWNPVVWLFFPECQTVSVYRETLGKMLELPFGSVLCSHAPKPRSRAEFESFVEDLSLVSSGKSNKVVIPPYESIQTRSLPLRDGGQFVFDANKLD